MRKIGNQLTIGVLPIDAIWQQALEQQKPQHQPGIRQVEKQRLVTESETHCEYRRGTDDQCGPTQTLAHRHPSLPGHPSVPLQFSPQLRRRRVEMRY